MVNYYQILEVSSDANYDQIRKAFRKLAKEIHPDVNKDIGSKEKFQKLNEAHQTLSDPAKRRLYNLRLRHGIIIQTVHYRPATSTYRPTYKGRGANYAKREQESTSKAEAIFDNILFYLLLIIGLYGILFGLYRVFIDPPKNDEINPYSGLIGGAVFTFLLVFLYFIMRKSKRK